MEEITVGTGLTLSAGTLSATATGGGLLHGIAAGTDTYTVTIAGATAYADGDAYLINFTNGNTTSCTLNINGQGAIALWRNNDGPLIGGDIVSGGEILCVYRAATNVFQCIGTAPNTLLAYVTNAETTTITKGQAVYVSGGVGDRIKVKLASNLTDATSAQTIGIVQSTSIAANQKGLVVVQGQLDNLSLFPTATWADGDFIYLGATPGSLTNVKPFAPNHLVYLGYVTTASNGSAGRMYVKVQNGYEMGEIHDVYINPATLANNDLLQYNSATDLWLNKSLSAAGIQPTITLTTTGSSGASTLIGSTLNIPQYGGGTVTSVAALTLGTSGTDLSSTVANGTTTPVITLNVPDASATARGVITTGTQTIAGAKTFSTGIIASYTSANTIASISGTGQLTGLNTSGGYPDLTELTYVKGVTSAIQTQLNAKQNSITLTTTGTSGPATLVGATLNIPQYSGGGGGSTPVKLTSQTLAVGSWTLVGSYYTYAFSNVNVTTTCDVSVTPQNASYQTAYNANVLPFVGVAAGVATFYAQFPPQANMVVDIVITQTT
jgi:hypothetical protein